MEDNQWLRFNGTNLGYIDSLSDIIDWLQPFVLPSDPTREWFYVRVLFNNRHYYAWMRGFIPQQVSQAIIIDELKPVFGMKKIGTHSFRCRQKLMIVNGVVSYDDRLTHYVLFKAPYTRDDSGDIVFIQPESPHNVPLLEEHIEQLQKITLFREIVGINHRGLESINMLQGNLFVIDLYIAKVPSKAKTIKPKQNQQLFPYLLLRQEITQRMLQIDRDNFEDKLADLGDRLHKLVERVDKNYIWYANVCLDNIRSRMSVYFHLEDTYTS